MATKPVPLSTFANRPATVLAALPSVPEATAEKLRQKVFRVTAAQDRKIKEFCAHSDMTTQDLVIEGINLVLKSKGLPTI